MIEHLSDLAFFVSVVEAGSFTAAARERRLSTSYLSRRLRLLEDALGVRLLHRTTRKLALTDAGRALYEQAAPHLEGLLDAGRAAGAQQAEPRGILRLAAPHSFAMRWLLDPLGRFLARWPALRLEASFDDRTHDLIGEGYDLAIRGGRLPDTGLVARRLCGFQTVVAASPSWIARHGAPTHPQDLARATLLDYSLARSTPGWWFQSPTGEERRVEVDPRRAIVADSGEALIAWARAGLGVVYQPEFLLHEPLRTGELVALLPGWRTWEAAFHAVYPTRRHLSPAVRLLVEHLVHELAGPPWARDASPDDAVTSPP